MLILFLFVVIMISAISNANSNARTNEIKENYMTEAFRARHPEVPASDIAEFRDYLNIRCRNF